MPKPRSLRFSRARSSRKRSPGDYQEALRLCENAAAQVKAASDELAACWNSLGRGISDGATKTDLLRRRAWCNVLELRLKEHAHALEDARHAVDDLWSELMLKARRDGTFEKDETPAVEEGPFNRSWSLLIQPRAQAAVSAAAIS